MELRAYLRLVRNGWWLLATGTIVAVVAAVVATGGQAPVYRAEATYVVRPTSALLADDIVRAVDTLSGNVEVNGTFAGIAQSRRVKDAALTSLGLDSSGSGVDVDATVRLSTNIVEIAAEAGDAATAAEVANAVGTATIEYVDSLGMSFELEPLDAARQPTRAEPTGRTLRLVLAAVLGMLTGLGVVLFREYWRRTAEDDAGPSDDAGQTPDPDPSDDGGDSVSPQDDLDADGTVMDTSEYDEGFDAEVDPVELSPSVRVSVISRDADPFALGHAVGTMDALEALNDPGTDPPPEEDDTDDSTSTPASVAKAKRATSTTRRSRSKNKTTTTKAKQVAATTDE